MKKIAVWDTFLNDAQRELVRRTAAETGYAADFITALPEGRAGEYEILYGVPRPQVLRELTGLKWFHGAFAGVDRYVDDGLYAAPGVVLTSSTGAYGVTLAEHLMMVSLMLLRRYGDFAAVTAKHQWQQQIPMRSICGCRITVLGAGDIGTAFARRARAMGAAHICGVRRSHTGGDPCFDEVVTFRELDDVLPRTELLIMALPDTPETKNILSRQRIALLPPEAYVVNVGRGTAIDQEALMEALNEERIAGAALDVMVPEPLPPDHPLWDTRNLLLTPHCGGNFSLPVTRQLNVELFCDNLRRYAAGEPLRNVVDRRRGY